MLFLLLLVFAVPFMLTEQVEYPSIYCDYFVDPDAVDEGNFGDGFCSLGAEFGEAEKILESKVLYTDDNQTDSLGNTYQFPNYAVTRVNVINFGRYHAGTEALGLINQEGVGSAEVYLYIPSKKGVRVYIEIYGIALE